MELDRQLISSGAKWEAEAGYSRAVRVGPFVSVSGTTAPGDTAYDQAAAALRVIGDALATAGASFADVVRTRMYLTDVSEWQEVTRAHAEVFGDIRPAATLVEVSRLIEPGLRVEIEADAIIR